MIGNSLRSGAALLALFLAAVTPTFAQTSTPTATELLTKSATAMQGITTYRLKGFVKIKASALGTVTLKTRGAMVTSPPALRLHISPERNASIPATEQQALQRLHLEMIEANNKVALRERGGSWQCAAASAANSAVPGTGLIPSAPTTVPSTTSITGTVSSGTVASTPVWRVSIPLDQFNSNAKPTTATGNLRGTMTLSIDQSDYLMRRVRLTIKTNSQGTALREVIQFTLSNFGAPVTISLPSACKSH